MLSPQNENILFWSTATVSGLLFTVVLFLTLNNLKLVRIVDPAPVMVVDFTQWREPIKEPLRTPKTETPKPKPVPRPVIKPKPKPKPEPLPKPKLEPTIEPPKPEYTDSNPTPQPQLTEDTITTPDAPSAPPVTGAVIPQQTLPTPMPIFKLTSMPRFAHMAETIYPPAMQAQGKEAVVKLKILIDNKGIPRKITVTESGGPDFDQAAIAAIKASTFVPATMNGKAVAVILRVPIKFELD